MQWATIHYQTPPEDSAHSAQNLIDNQESRSSSNLLNARTDTAYYGAKASYNSCYVTTSANIATDGDQVKVVLDFQVPSFIHAVLMLDD